MFKKTAKIQSLIVDKMLITLTTRTEENSLVVFVSIEAGSCDGSALNRRPKEAVGFRWQNGFGTQIQGHLSYVG